MTDFAAIDRDWSRRLGVNRSSEFATPVSGTITYALPEDDDPFLWRFVMNSRTKVHSIAELDRDWTYSEMLSLHAQLDAIEDALAREHESPKGGR